MSELEQQVNAVILEWDASHTTSRGAEVIALVRGAVADEITADRTAWQHDDPPAYSAGLRYAALIARHGWTTTAGLE